MRTREHDTSMGAHTARSGAPAPRRARRRIGLAATAGVLMLGLVACQEGWDTTRVTAPAWTEAEIAAVFDLSELGRLSPAPSGEHLLLAGRVLPADVVERFPHLTIGRASNLLAFDDDALAAMSTDARRLVEHASPGELRALMRRHGVTMRDVHEAWASRGRIGLVELFDVAERLDARSAEAGLAVLGSGGGAGARLLLALGVDR